jgi:hypothetical protein
MKEKVNAASSNFIMLQYKIKQKTFKGIPIGCTQTI